MTLREVLRRSPTARACYRRGRWLRQRVLGLPWAVADRLFEQVSFERLPPRAAVRMIYQVMLRRDPDPSGFADNLGRLTSGLADRTTLAQDVRGSEEFQTIGFTGRAFGASIHAGRCQFIRSLPPARRIVDLGGTHLARDVGAMVALGYPYPFEELTIVDLPSEDRHEIYRSVDGRTRVDTPLGPVTYRYHSMVDLSGFADASVDLVYSGQSIEHVTPADGAKVLSEVARILRPGGHLGLDTPNGRVTRLAQEELIDPDHEVEYTWPELRAMIEDAGLEVVRAEGLNYAGPAAAAGRFDQDEAARNWGLHSALEDCYILAVVARKPTG